MQPLPFRWQEEELLLHPLKALYWPFRKLLLLADLHLGKTFHFRREGFAVPARAGDLNWEKLIALLLDLQPERVIFLGDLFHSSYNPEWEEFGGLRAAFFLGACLPNKSEIAILSNYVREITSIDYICLIGRAVLSLGSWDAAVDQVFESGAGQARNILRQFSTLSG